MTPTPHSTPPSQRQPPSSVSPPPYVSHPSPTCVTGSGGHHGGHHGISAKALVDPCDCKRRGRFGTSPGDVLLPNTELPRLILLGWDILPRNQGANIAHAPLFDRIFTCNHYELPVPPAVTAPWRRPDVLGAVHLLWAGLHDRSIWNVIVRARDVLPL